MWAARGRFRSTDLTSTSKTTSARRGLGTEEVECCSDAAEHSGETGGGETPSLRAETGY
jgi:hypothetical protein